MQEALSRTLSQNATGLPAVIHLANGTYHVNASAPEFTIDGSTRASEVRLLGDGSSVLRALPGTGPLLRLLTGAPPVTIRGLQLQSQIAVAGAKSVRIEDCRLQQSSSVLGGALVISDGSVSIVATEFVDNVALAGGGAVSVSGGEVAFQGCLLAHNFAANATGGGALLVTGGTVRMTRTLLRNNHAGSSNDAVEISIVLVAGQIIYQLPAPLGHWVPAFGHGETSLDPVPYKSYPYPCAPGLVGRTDHPSVQKDPGCGGLCPPGYVCEGGTWNPQVCPAGGFCPEGSPAMSPCEEGSYSNSSGLTRASDCDACPPGSACRGGDVEPTACPAGRFSPRARMNHCIRCEAGKFQPVDGKTSCDECLAGSFCEEGAPVGSLCPGGSFANVTGLTSEASCQQCPSDMQCYQGSTEPMLCPPGTHAPWGNAARCTICPVCSCRSLRTCCFLSILMSLCSDPSCVSAMRRRVAT